MLVSQGTSWRIEEDFARLCQRDVPFKCLLICWAPEREAPDTKDLSIYLSTVPKGVEHMSAQQVLKLPSGDVT